MRNGGELCPTLHVTVRPRRIPNLLTEIRPAWRTAPRAWRQMEHRLRQGIPPGLSHPHIGQPAKWAICLIVHAIDR
jgi:hypothetical protein